MRKSVLFSGLMMLALGTSAFAQGRVNNGAQNRNGGAALPLPDGVKSVVSIDAYNILLAQVETDDGRTDLAPIIVRHVYSGGIAKLFGGGTIPTEQFVSPGALNGGNGGNGGNRGGFGGQTGITGGGGQNGFNGQNGINAGGFGNQTGNGGNNFGGGFGGGNFGVFQIRPTARN